MTSKGGGDWSILCCLAEKGYFLSDHNLYKQDDKIPFSSVEQKPYGIRRATVNDIPKLVEIEKVCWGPMNMAVGVDVLNERIISCPMDQWVAVRQQDGCVVGVIYTQRIANLDFAKDDSFSFADIASIREPCGPILQLVAVAVLPEVTNLQLGNALRNFMLLQALVNNGILKVVAITRCSAFIPDRNSESLLDMYVDYVFRMQDPTIKFHCEGGAKILSTMQHFYRPEDENNLGSGVLIGYYCSDDDVDLDFNHIVGDMSFRESDTLRNTETMRPSFDESPISFTLETVKDILLDVLGNDISHVVNSKGFENMPFMVIGLDSLHMVDFSKRLESFTTGDGFLPSTFLFDYPTPRSVVEYFSEEKACGDSNDNGMPPDNNENSCMEYAVVGMSCRFPGGADSPEKFYQLLCSRYNPVGPIPESWEWNLNTTSENAENESSKGYAKKRKVGLLDDLSAESFDASLFGLSKAEVSSMDPHQRLLLTIGYEALLDAEVFVEDDSRNDIKSIVDTGKRDVGVFVGLCNTSWSGIEMQSHMFSQGGDSKLSAYSGMGTAVASAANRLSFLLNLVGPSMVVDTACSSSLAAIHMACLALREGDCSTALIAAADLLLCPYDLEVCCGIK